MNQPSENCEWKYNRTAWSDLWEGTCETAWTITDGGPFENGFNFCPNCGKPIEVVSDTDELEEEE